MIDLAQTIAHQQVAAGMVGATVAGGVLYQLRALPKRLLDAGREAFTVSLTVDNDDEAFKWLAVWLARHRVSRRARRLMLEAGYDYDLGQWRREFTLGFGWHLLLVGARPVFVHRWAQDPTGLDKLVSPQKRERLTFVSLGRSQAALRKLVPMAEAAFLGGERVEVWFWHQGGWWFSDRKARRGLETVFAPEAQKRRLAEDVAAFLGAQADYRRRGIPWRRGYLLKGPPGTGKTTLVQVIAGLFDRKIYSINLNSVASDNDLLAAFNQAQANALIVIEDIDGAKITHDREQAAAEEAQVVANGGVALKSAGSGVTLSGLLNAIDGVAAREGRLLFITSNHAEKLDPALVRPGRVDVVETIDRLGREDAWAMFLAFLPEAEASLFERLVAPRLPIAPAELQNLLLTHEASEVMRGQG